MKGLTTSSRHSTCFSNNQIASILTGLCFFCPSQTPTRSTENHISREKQHGHVPTHAASSFLKTTSPPTIGRAAEPILDNMPLRDVDLEMADSGVIAPDRGAQVKSVLERAAPDEIIPGAIVPNESPPDELALKGALPDRLASDGLGIQAEQPGSESPTLGDSMSEGLT